MKKLLLLTLLLFAVLQTEAFTYTDSNGIEWTFTGGGTNARDIKPSDKSSISGEIVIPGTVYYGSTALTVTTIGSEAFRGCSGLTSVTIPSSVTGIGASAFRDCTGLTSVTIPEGVTSIGSYLFYNCSSLTSVTIPESVTSIGCDVFYNTGIYNDAQAGFFYVDNWLFGYKGDKPTGAITLAEGTRGIASFAFKNCTGLTSVTIPSSVTGIGSSAFQNCYSLTKVIVPDIAAWCNIRFGSSDANPLNYARHLYSDENTEITDLEIPEGVSSIGFVAFLGCSSLTSVTIPSSVTGIGSSAFSGCSGLTKVIAPDIVAWCNIQFGGSYANPLYYANHLYSDENTEITDLVIPEALTSIGNYAFQGCSGLTSVTIPSSVTSIGNYAFQGCTGLTSVTIPDGVTRIGDSTFKGCSSLTSVTIPDGVTSIGGQAFYDCSVLTSVTIPDGVTSIGNTAFKGCSSLTSVYCYTVTPPGIQSLTFSDSNIANATLYVPIGYAGVYNDTDYWNQFGSIVEMELEVVSAPVFSLEDNWIEFHPGDKIEFRLACDEPDVTIYWRYAWTAGWDEENEREIGEGNVTFHYNEDGEESAWYLGSSMPWMVYQVDNPEEEGYPLLNIHGYNWYVEARAVKDGMIGSEITRQHYKAFGPRAPEIWIMGGDDDDTVNPDMAELYMSDTYLNGFKYIITTIGDSEKVLKTIDTWNTVEGDIDIWDEEDFIECYTSIDLTDLYGNNREYYIYVVPTWNGEVEYYEEGGEPAGWTSASFFIDRTPTELTINMTGNPRTYSCAYDLDFTGITDMKAYIASGFDPSTGKLVLTQVDEVPAGTGLYLKGAAGDYTVPVKATSMVLMNLLVGVTEDTEVSPTTATHTNFILANGKHGISFYTLSEAGIITAGKAYLSLPTSDVGAMAGGFTMAFEDEETTGISEEVIVNSEQSTGDWYTLDGRRLDKKPTQKGVYIVNGKKMVVK